MHIKQWSWSDWLVIVTAVTLVSLVLLAHRHGSFSAKATRIHLGMTYKEVETGMGKPTRTVKEDAYWYDEDGEFFVSFGGVAGTVDQKQYYSRQILLSRGLGS
jgi:hypothetical protein